MSDAEETPLERIEKRRAARKAELEAQWKAQRAVDLEQVDALEVEHGDSNIAYIDIPYTPGMPTLIACRCPTKPEVHRYRDRVKVQPNGKPGDSVRGADELASVCRVYPDKDAYAEVIEARPGVHTQLGVAAIKLASGKEAEEGKG